MINHPNRSRKRAHPLDTTRNEALALINKIADRAVQLYAEFGIRVERRDLVMDLMACHFSVQKLRLNALLAADDFNFAHDVGGIRKHLCRDTYALKDFFSPRFSARQTP